jgi:hypothetical protein
MAFLFIHHQSKNQICLKKSQNPHKITKNYSFSIRSRNHNYHYRPKTILCVFLHIKHWMSGLHASPFTSSDNVIAHDDHAQQPPNSFLIFFLCVYVCVCDGEYLKCWGPHMVRINTCIWVRRTGMKRLIWAVTIWS